MKRTKLRDRDLPDYTKGEEVFNMTSHIVGGAIGLAAHTPPGINSMLISFSPVLHIQPRELVGAHEEVHVLDCRA